MKKSGFTLIEMIIVLALTTLILGILYSIFYTGNKVFSDADVRFNLQMEAKNIQEELTTIGMQGIGVTDITIDGDIEDEDGRYVNKKFSDLASTSIGQIKLEAYGKDSEYSKDASGHENISNLQPYNIIFDNGSLKVDWTDSSNHSKTLSTHVKSFTVVPADPGDRFANTSSIEFNIVLSSQKVFSRVPDYPIKVKVTFRNKDN